MDNTLGQLSQLLQNNKGAVDSILRSQDGKRLMEIMGRQGGQERLQKAAASAAKGNTAELAQMVQAMMATPEGGQLVSRIRDAVEGKK